jgi:hypothetical protein
MKDSAGLDWDLGVWVAGPEDVPVLERVRRVSSAEFESIEAGMQRLRAFGCYSLDGGLPEALDAIDQMIDGMSASPMVEVNSSAFKVRLRILINQWLAQLTAIRTHFEWLATIYPTDGASADISQMYRHLHRTDPAFRLVWELRNLSQHDQPISNYLSFRVQLEDTGVIQGNYYLDLAKLAPANSGKTWKACFELWPNAPETIDLQILFRAAYLASYRVAASYAFDFRDQLDVDARAVVAMANEVGGRGPAILYQFDDAKAGPNLPPPITTLDLRREILDEAWKSLENARRFLADPSIGALVPLPRFSDTPVYFSP